MKWALWFLGAFVVPLLVSLWHQEVYAWCPNLAKRLIFLASFLVPREHRARYRNEWLAELDTLEGKNLSQVLFALGIILSAPRTRLALIASPSRSNKWLKGLSQAIPVWPRQERRRLTALVEELADRQSELKDAIRREVVATDRLRAAEFYKDTLLLAVSHELQGPLDHILRSQPQFEDLELDGSGETTFLLQQYFENAYELHRLLEIAFSCSLMDDYLLHVEPNTADLKSVVCRVVDRMLEEGSLDGRPVQIDIPSITAKIDASIVETIVENLLFNAIQFSEEATSISIWASSERHDLDLVIESPAPGTPPALAEIVYRKGSAQDSADAIAYGVRLSFVLRLAELHDGAMWLEARPAQNTRIHVTMPDVVQ